MHHLPVKGAGFTDDNKIRIDVGNGKAGFIKLVNQCAFTDHVGFLAFLAAQEISGGHRGGIKGAIRHVDPGGRKAVCQVLPGLGRVVGQHHQRHIFLKNAFDKFGSARHGHIVVHQHAVNITDYVLNGHGQSDIFEERRNYIAALAFQQTLEQYTVEHGAFHQRKSADCGAVI